jgi:Subtilase family
VMRGVSPTSPILPVRVYDANGSANADALARGIALAVQKGAGTIVFSGAQKLSEVGKADQLKVVRAIAGAFKKGVLTVVAAGNDGDSEPSFPSALPHVIAVGAASPSGIRATFSNTGPWVDLLAPAEGVTAPLPPPSCVYGYGFATGTSFAAPSVAGLAALVAQLRPQLNVQQRFELVRRAARDIGIEGRDNESGFGMTDVGAAMTGVPQAKENNPEVDDDPFWVRGAYTKAYPPYVNKRKKVRFKATGSVSPAKDPADVYPVEMDKGDRIVVTVSGTSAGALLELSILSPSAGDFDITNAVDKNRMVSTGGLSPDPQLEVTAKKSGIHYIAIEAADPVDPEDPTAQPADIEPYRVSAFKQHRTKKKAKNR